MRTYFQNCLRRSIVIKGFIYDCQRLGSLSTTIGCSLVNVVKLFHLFWRTTQKVSLNISFYSRKLFRDYNTKGFFFFFWNGLRDHLSFVTKQLLKHNNTHLSCHLFFFFSFCFAFCDLHPSGSFKFPRGIRFVSVLRVPSIMAGLFEAETIAAIGYLFIFPKMIFSFLMLCNKLVKRFQFSMNCSKN